MRRNTSVVEGPIYVPRVCERRGRVDVRGRDLRPNRLDRAKRSRTDIKESSISASTSYMAGSELHRSSQHEDIFLVSRSPASSTPGSPPVDACGDPPPSCCPQLPPAKRCLHPIPLVILSATEERRGDLVPSECLWHVPGLEPFTREPSHLLNCTLHRSSFASKPPRALGAPESSLCT
jgi:hypothetical protein